MQCLRAALGTKSVLPHDNHGVMVCWEIAWQAWDDFYHLERQGTSIYLRSPWQTRTTREMPGSCSGHREHTAAHASRRHDLLGVVVAGQGSTGRSKPATTSPAGHDGVMSVQQDALGFQGSCQASCVFCLGLQVQRQAMALSGEVGHIVLVFCSYLWSRK